MSTRVMMTMALAATLALAACGGGGGDQQQAADEPGTDRYTVRGQVVRLPQETGDTAMYIRHAEIPDYKNEDGEVVGMMAMTMPFPVGEGVSIEGLAPGDPVEFTFTVRYKPTGRYEIVAIEELPAGTDVDGDGHEGHDHGDGHDHSH